MTVEAAVPAALKKLRAARLPLQNYFGAAEATIFSRRESRRTGSHDAISFNLPKLGFGADVTRQTPYLSV